MASIPGFIDGFVTNNLDPERQGRIKARVPGLFNETPYWCRPTWPGSGGIGQGSQYPVMVGAQVSLIFDHGDSDLGAIYLPGMYGKEQGVPVMTTPVRAASTAEKAVQTIVLWDDPTFSVFLSLENDYQGLAGREVRQLVLLEKESGGGIVIDARDGNDQTGHTISIEARTGIIIRSRGVIKIQGDQAVEIQGRRVMKSGGSI